MNLSNEKLIRAGDKVTIFWETINIITGIVLYSPSAFGECWIVEDSTGNVHYIMAFSRITKYKKKDEEGKKLPEMRKES